MMKVYKKLWTAVLERAINDAQGDVKDYRGSYVKYITEAAGSWFHSKEEGIGSFLWICSQLDLNPEYVLNLLNNKKWGSQVFDLNPVKCRNHGLINMLIF